jgi:DNA-binding MarR family transcriptional regulator
MPKPEITREQIEAAKHTMIRRQKDLSIYARLVLAELISYDFIDNRTGQRKGEVWCSQQTIASNLGVSRHTVHRHIKQVVQSPFVRSVRCFQDQHGSHYAYVLDWEQIQKHTIQHITGTKVRRVVAESDNPPPENEGVVADSYRGSSLRATGGGSSELHEIIEGKLQNPQIIEPVDAISDEIGRHGVQGDLRKMSQPQIKRYLRQWELPCGFKFRDGMGIDRIPYPALDPSWPVSERDYLQIRAQWYTKQKRLRRMGAAQ